MNSKPLNRKKKYFKPSPFYYLAKIKEKRGSLMFCFHVWPQTPNRKRVKVKRHKFALGLKSLPVQPHVQIHVYCHCPNPSFMSLLLSKCYDLRLTWFIMFLMGICQTVCFKKKKVFEKNMLLFCFMSTIIDLFC